MEAAQVAPSRAGADDPVIQVKGVSKTYSGGFQALDEIDLEIRRGEIFALLGPNGAGKTTLISIICGLVTISEGRVLADGFDIESDYREARSRIGLVPQELHTEAFESVWNTVSFSRGLFGKAPDPAYQERILRELSLWDKKDEPIMNLSGGMKRRVMIAKALSHEPDILFLDEPTAGVDVELRREMWDLVRRLRDSGVTIILTTHYIAEAEEMSDRVAVINHGRIIVVDETEALMRKMGRKMLIVQLAEPMDSIPQRLARTGLELAADGAELVYHYDTQAERTGITELLRDLREADIAFRDLRTRQDSLEEIFVNLVRDRKEVGP